jgi:hypothetical protein
MQGLVMQGQASQARSSQGSAAVSELAEMGLVASLHPTKAQRAYNVLVLYSLDDQLEPR